MRRLAGILVVGAAAIGCSGAGGGSGTPGAGGSLGGAGGAGGGSGGGGGDPAFQVVAPCEADSSYITSGATIAFGGGEGDSYNPPCLQVTAGTTVSFVGDFVTHPLTPSAARGTLTGNPITATAAGTTASFTFPAAGFWAYYCAIHGSDADGQRMTGVIWVK